MDPVGSEQRRITHNRLEEIISYCKNNDIHTIARIVVGKDPILADYMDSKNSILEDTIPSNWVDLFSPEVQEYNIQIAKEAERWGFDEINFDYIRFPDPLEVKNPSYPFRKGRPLADGVREFLERADADLNAEISVDVYAYTVWGNMSLHQDESHNRIGQVIELMGEYADYIYPMLYPSHFSDMDRESIARVHRDKSVEYSIISEGCRRAVQRLRNYGDSTTKVVPWIQGFKMKDYFNEAYILNQIDAAEENNIDGYLIWNPRNDYQISSNALRSKEQEM